MILFFSVAFPFNIEDNLTNAYTRNNYIPDDIYKNIQDKASRALGEALYQGLDI